MQTVALYYWAGAKAAAGVASETVAADTVAEALRTVLRARPDGAFPQVIGACAVLVDSVAAGPDDLERVLTGPVRVDVLPPFAGGSGVHLRAYPERSAHDRPIV